MTDLKIPEPIKKAVEKLSLPQALLMQGILLDHCLKLIGLSLKKSSVIKPSSDDLT